MPDPLPSNRRLDEWAQQSAERSRARRSDYGRAIRSDAIAFLWIMACILAVLALLILDSTRLT